MKLKLIEEKGAHVLDIEGEVDLRGFKILKAGIAKLLKDGKNKMILDFSRTPKIDPGCLRELAELNLIARELSGEILLASLSPMMRMNIENLGKPSALTCFPSRAAALTILTRMGQEPEDEEEDEDTKGMGVEELLAKKKDEVKGLKDQLKQRETGELSKLREQLVTYQTNIKTLEQKVLASLKERRQSDDLAIATERSMMLEKRCVELSQALEESDKGKK